MNGDEVDSDFTATEPNTSPEVGDRIDVFWPLDNQYYSGIVSSYDDDGKATINYDDSEIETLDMSKETWKLSAASSALSMKIDSNTLEQQVLKLYQSLFQNKTFMRHQAQSLEQFPIINAYKAEEETFLKTVTTVPIKTLPQDANIIGSHTIYKVKMNDDKTLKLKARIAPHGNEDDLKHLLTKDCAICPPTGMHILESIASLYGWKIVRGDVKTAFLQTGKPNRDVYVKPPAECKRRNEEFWLLDTAAYGLVNANAK